MNNILESYQKYPGLTEAYEVVRTAEVVHNSQVWRLEVLKCYSNPPIFYKVRYSRYETVVLQQSDMSSGKYDNEPESMLVLVEQFGMPWVHQYEPEIALHQALNFLTGAE